jgi:hypothetical protein
MDEAKRGGHLFSFHIFEEGIYVTDINVGQEFS